MIRSLTGFVAGLVFGFGLIISQMVNPAKILAFLDVAGEWDPGLALVMAGAVVTTMIGYRIAARLDQPWLAASFALPTRKDIDARLVGGAALFGVGWGLTGFCPAPAMTALSLGQPSVVAFVVAMLVGMFGWRWVKERPQASSGHPTVSA